MIRYPGRPGGRSPVFAVLAVIAIVASACGPNAATVAPPSDPSTTAGPSAPASQDAGLPTEPVTIRVGYFNAGGQPEIDHRQVQAEAFTAAHPNVTIKLEPLTDWGEQMYPQIAAGRAPDVIWSDTDTGYGHMVGLRAFQPLDPYIAAEAYDLTPWPASILDHFKGLDGGQLLLPNSNLSFNFLYYNRDLFDAATLPYPTADWSVDDLLTAARALTVEDEQWGLAFAWSELYVAWMRMYGCELSDDRAFPTAYTYNGPSCAEALTELDTLSREGVLNWDYGSLGPGDTAGEQNFSLGNVAMLLSGTWEAGAIVANSGGAFEFDAAPVPLAANGTIQGAASGFGMYSGTDHPEWAWEVIKFLVGPEGQADDARIGLGQSPIPSILDEVYCQSDAPPANKCEVAQQSAGNTVWEPVTDKWAPGFWDVIIPGLELGFTASAAPDWQGILDELVATSTQAAPLP